MSVYGDSPQEVVDLYLREKWGKDYKDHYVSKVKKGDMLQSLMKNRSVRSKVNKLKSMDDSQYKALLQEVLGLV